MSHLDKQTVLVINKAFQIIGTTSPKKAYVAMSSESAGGNLAAKAVIVDYLKNEDGTYDFEQVTNVQPVFFDEWIMQELRPFDEYVTTSKLKIRIPTVLQAHNFNKIVVRQLKPTKRNLYHRYNGRCAYTNKELTLGNMTTDHVIPKSRWKGLGKTGSSDIWENVVPCDKEINHKKGNLLNEEAGLKLLVKPSAPRAIPVSELIREIRNRDWSIFMHK